MDCSNCTTMAPLVQKHLKKQLTYDVVSFLASGSTSSVFKLVDLKSGAFLAAKIIDRNKLDPMIQEELLPNELAIVQEVRHPYITRVDMVLSVDNFSVIVSEFATDGDLIDHIDRTTSPNWELAKRWFNQLVQAVVYLHSKGIAHRDIKAENILICNGTAKITDFGNATHCLDANGQVVLSASFSGTLEYKAPESLKYEPYNPLVGDSFSLGVLLYVMVTHQFPFGSGDSIRTYHGLCKHFDDITSKKWKPNQAIDADPSLHSLLSQLLEPDVNQRITSKRALEHPWHQQQQPSSTSPTSNNME